MSELSEQDRQIITNPQLIAEIKRDEGVRLKPYRCPAGYWTVGVGWNLEANGLPAEVMKQLCENGGQFNDKIVTHLLDISLEIALEDAKRLFPTFYKLTPARQRVVINMALNLGYTRLMGFKRFRLAVVNKDWEKAYLEMLDSRWARQVKTRAGRLAQMMLKG